MLKKTKKVSVIMATYNTPEKYLIDSIDSILNQSHANLELIIVCDGSEKDVEIVEKYADSRIKIIKHTSNEGLAKSMNDAIDIADGEYIARMDSDDIALKNRLKVQVEYLEKHKEIMVLSNDVINFGKNNQVGRRFLPKSETLFTRLLWKNTITHPTVMFRSSFLRENNIRYDKEFKTSQDYELWARACSKDNFKNLKRILLLYRIHDKQITSTKHNLQIHYSGLIHRALLVKAGLDDEKYFEMLSVLGEQIPIEKSNYRYIAEKIDDIVRENTYYDKKLLEKELCMQYFELMFSYKVLKNYFNEVMSDKIVRNKLLRLYNIKVIGYKIQRKFENKLIKIFFGKKLSVLK